MSRRALQAFFAQSIADARSAGLLLSLHLKATMMKVSDPIMFGHAVREYYRDVFEKHAALFEMLGVDPDNGVGDVYSKIQDLPPAQRADIEADIKAVYASRPPLAMVDSNKGITNLRAERRHHRRVDACGYPRIRAHVGAGRRTARYRGDDPRSLLRRDLPGRH